MTVADEKTLIERHIAVERLGDPGDAWLRQSGVHVWALVGYWRAVGKDPNRVAEAYELPREAIDAVLAFYRRHKPEIDGRLAAIPFT